MTRIGALLSWIFSLAVVVLLAFVFAVAAQQPPVQEIRLAQAAKPQPNAPAPVAAKPAPRPVVPDPNTMVMLIRSALIALNQANLTGNYAVFRDLAAPGFRDVNNPAKLSESFANLRARKLDLTPIVLFDPKLAHAPFINERGMLRLKGFFPTQPEQVNFDLAFQLVEGKWRLFGIGVNTVRAMPVESAPAQPQPPPGQARPALLPASQPPAPAALQVPPPTRNPAGGGATPQFVR